MQQGRECKLIVVVGKKAVGKTFETNKMIHAALMGNPAIGLLPRRTLIMDINNEFQHIKTLSVQDVTRFSVHPTVEIRRIRPFHDNGKKMTLNEFADTLMIVLANYYQGILLIEDPNKYISDNMPQDLIGAICTNRHQAVDVIMHYQSIGRIVPKIWQNTELLRFHKNGDSVAKHQNKFEEKYELFKIVEGIVNEQYLKKNNKRFFIWVDLDEMRIASPVSMEDFEYSVNQYVSSNYRQTITPMLQMVDTKGELLYDKQSAYAAFVQQMKTLYLPK